MSDYSAYLLREVLSRRTPRLFLVQLGERLPEPQVWTWKTYHYEPGLSLLFPPEVSVDAMRIRWKDLHRICRIDAELFSRWSRARVPCPQ